MEVQHPRESHKYRQRLFEYISITIFLMTLLLLATTTWSIFVYTGDEYTKRITFDQTIKSTYEYFDWNRNQLGIKDVYIKKKDLPCPNNGTWEEANLYNWPGSVLGYKKDNQYFKGSNLEGQEIIKVKEQIPNVNFWQSAKFCLQRVKSSDFEVRANVKDACPSASKSIICSRCECFKDPAATSAPPAERNCPLSNIQYTLKTTIDSDIGNATKELYGFKYCGADNVKVKWDTNSSNGDGLEWSAACKWGLLLNQNLQKRQGSYLISIMAEFYDKPCKDPKEHSTYLPKNSINSNSDISVLLKQAHSGCDDTFGQDDLYSEQIAQQEISQWLKDNVDKMSATDLGEFYNSYSTSTKNIKLFGRYKIETKCDDTCSNFRFQPKATSLTDNLMDAWGQLKTICWVSSVLTTVVITFLIVNIFMKRKSTQAHWLWLYLICIATIIILIILIFIFIYSIQNKYNESRDYFKEKKSCIIDTEEWQKLPLNLYLITSLENIRIWAQVFGYSLIFCLAFGIFQFFSVLKRLGDIKQQRYRQLQMQDQV